MKTKMILSTLVFECVFRSVVGGATLLASPPTEPVDAANLISKIRSSAEADRTAAAAAILDERGKLIAQLRRTVQESVLEPETGEIAGTAISLLGDLRAVEAAPILVQKLTFRPEPTSPGPSRRVPIEEALEGTPVGALIKIGLPSLPPLLERVAVSDDERVSSCAAMVVGRVLGAELGVLYVKRHIARETDEAKIRRLTRLAEGIAKLPARGFCPY